MLLTYTASENSGDEEEGQIMLAYNSNEISSLKRLDSDVNIEDAKYQLSLQKRKFVLRGSDERKFIWDLIIIVLGILNISYLPIVFAFDQTVTYSFIMTLIA